VTAGPQPSGDAIFELLGELRDAGPVSASASTAIAQTCAACRAEDGDIDPVRLRNWLAPVLHSPEEQQELHRIFQTWWSRRVPARFCVRCRRTAITPDETIVERAPPEVMRLLPLRSCCRGRAYLSISATAWWRPAASQAEAPPAVKKFGAPDAGDIKRHRPECRRERAAQRPVDPRERGGPAGQPVPARRFTPRCGLFMRPDRPAPGARTALEW
jgi:hypothetical protein